MISTSGMCMGMARLPMWRQEWFFWRIGLGCSVGRSSREFRCGPWVARPRVDEGRLKLICPFWVKHKKGQEEKVFLVPFLYMRPPSSHTWALLCTQDELGQVQKARGVLVSEIGGVLQGTREVGGVDQGTALVARVEAFWLR